MPDVIHVEGLTKIYGYQQRGVTPVLAVDHIHFSVRKGEVFGFLGPNGAGKTTTHKMLTTLLEPTEGHIYVNGYDIGRSAYSAKRQIGLVPEESNVYTELTGWGNLMFTARLYRVSRAERKKRAQELLEFFGLWEKRNVKAENYSKGMRRRLSIAMAIIHRPAILFLDEPTPGLDAQSTRAIRNLIRQLNAEGSTIFLTTHQIEEANQLCDRVAIIDHGRIAAIDTPETLKQSFQQVQSVEISLQPEVQGHGRVLAAFPGVSSVIKMGDKWRLYTENPSALVPMIVRYAENHKLKVVSLNTLGPSLEDVFLQITGQEVGAVAHEQTDARDNRKGKKGRKRCQNA